MDSTQCREEGGRGSDGKRTSKTDEGWGETLQLRRGLGALSHIVEKLQAGGHRQTESLSAVRTCTAQGHLGWHKRGVKSGAQRTFQGRERHGQSETQRRGGPQVMGGDPLQH